MITVKPSASIQSKLGSGVRLDCVVAGSPTPEVFWTREADKTTWYPGLEHDNIYMARNNSLVFVKASLDNSGHYSCVGVNTAGSTLERSHVFVYDQADFSDKESLGHHSEFYHTKTDPDLAAARVALMERSIVITSLFPVTATSLKVTWRQETTSHYLEGYYVLYKEYRTRGQYASTKVLHAGATSYSINRLKEQY